MGRFGQDGVYTVLVVLFWGFLPALMLWGWARWILNSRARKSPSSKLFFVGFVLATASAILAVFSIWYARSIGGFPYRDPRLAGIFIGGLLLSLGGLISWLRGLFLSLRIPRTPSVLRWIALVSTAGTFAFWFITAMGE